MYSKKIVALAAVAAMAEQAVAFNVHRHLHRQVQADKRALETEVTTVWETVYVTEGAEAPAPTQPAPEPPVPAPQPTTMSTVTKPNPSTSELPGDGDATSAPPPVLNPVDPAPTQAPAPEPLPTTEIPLPNPVPSTTSSKEQPAPTEPAPEPTTSQPAPQPSNPPSGGSGSKRGMAYNDVNLANSLKSSCSSCGWAYNWGSSPSGDLNGMEFIPTLWGPSEDHTSHWTADADAAVAAGAKNFFSFNEPDNGGQSNIMDTTLAAQLHAQYMGPYVGKVQISAPSVTNSGNLGEGLDWLKNFVAACEKTENCHFDHCNLHWYSEAQWSSTLFDHISQGHDACGGKDIYLTEFAPIDGNSVEFMNGVIPKLDKISYLKGYSYFMVSEGSLMSGNSLSEIGSAYASL